MYRNLPRFAILQRTGVETCFFSRFWFWFPGLPFGSWPSAENLPAMHHHILPFSSTKCFCEACCRHRCLNASNLTFGLLALWRTLPAMHHHTHPFSSTECWCEECCKHRVRNVPRLTFRLFTLCRTLPALHHNMHPLSSIKYKACEITQKTTIRQSMRQIWDKLWDKLWDKPMRQTILLDN